LQPAKELPACNRPKKRPDGRKNALYQST